MNIEVCLISHGGKIRTNNEDNAYINGVYRHDDKEFFWEYSTRRKSRRHDRIGKILRAGKPNADSSNSCAAVFDGVGGEERGEVASRTAAEVLADMDLSLPPSVFVRQYAAKANHRILQMADDSGMASTYVLLLIIENKLYFSNMGDSRGYYLHDGKLTRMTKDHNMVSNLLEEGILTPEQAQNHPHRHAIYQYLGMEEEDYDIILEPYLAEEVVAESGDICLLCSDGLTDMLTEDEIAEIIRPDAKLRNKAALLLTRAMDRGGQDNITIALLELT